MHSHIKYLKVNLNSDCNFHCIFCRQSQKRYLLDQEALTIEEISKLIDGFTRLGLEHVKIIGREPLLREDIFDLIYLISSTKKLKQISLTTNGFFLKEKALALKGAGLTRVNINLNSLKPERFRKITGVDGLAKVIEGICAAKEADLMPIRINVVLIRGLNDSELEDFVALTVLYPIDVRFIEYIPNSINSDEFRNFYMPGFAVKNNIEFSFGPLILDKTNPGEGPAVYYQIKDAKGRVGFINFVSEFLCVSCNTLMMDNYGRAFSCLYSPTFIDIGQPLRNLEFKLLTERMFGCLKIKPQINKNTPTEQIEKYSANIQHLPRPFG